jgi:hypothetical protein
MGINLPIIPDKLENIPMTFFNGLNILSKEPSIELKNPFFSSLGVFSFYIGCSNLFLLSISASFCASSS